MLQIHDVSHPRRSHGFGFETIIDFEFFDLHMSAQPCVRPVPHSRNIEPCPFRVDFAQLLIDSFAFDYCWAETACYRVLE
jgi:hypothetical protein